MKLDKDIIKGIIYSKFDEKTGPEAAAWIPDLSPDTRNLVSLKSINLLVGERGLVPESLALFPFPSIKLKGLVKCLEIRDATRRGGVFNSSITVLFEEAYDSVFYKYMNNFEEIFNNIASNIVKLEETKEEKMKIKEVLNQFNDELLTILTELCEAELAYGESEAFPEKEGDELIKFRFKIIVCGDPAVGKTSTVLRFTDKAFKRTYIPTIGVNICEKGIQIENKKVEFVIWDIAGQSKFQIMRKHFYHGADGQLLIFDLTRPITFKNITTWYQDINSFIREDLGGLVIGNKSDLVDMRKIQINEMTKLVGELGLDFIETSALSGENVDEAFNQLGKILIEQRMGKN